MHFYPGAFSSFHAQTTPTSASVASSQHQSHLQQQNYYCIDFLLPQIQFRRPILSLFLSRSFCNFINLTNYYCRILYLTLKNNLCKSQKLTELGTRPRILSNCCLIFGEFCCDLWWVGDCWWVILFDSMLMGTK